MGKNPRHLHDPRAAAENPADAAVPGRSTASAGKCICRLSTRARWRAHASSRTPASARCFSQVAVFQRHVSSSSATIFGLGIMPYISASIIFQLLGSVWGPLEQLQKEGESGRKKINEYTRYATVVICIGQSWFYVSLVISNGWIEPRFSRSSHASTCRSSGISRPSITMTAGTIFLMWLGEQIDEFGIGNGISLLIMAGILAACRRRS